MPSTRRKATIGVFCGSRPGSSPEHLRTAERFGTALAARGGKLVYGAGGVGMMGAIAHSAAAGGAEVVGVIPGRLREREREQNAPGKIFVVRDMHRRKALMYKMADAFVVLPGGLGSMDELMEIATWKQLGFHRKPVRVLNETGFFDPLLGLLDHLVAEGFLSGEERELVQDVADVEAALDGLFVAGDSGAHATGRALPLAAAPTEIRGGASGRRRGSTSGRVPPTGGTGREVARAVRDSTAG